MDFDRLRFFPASDANISRNLPNGNGRNKFGLSLPRGGGPSNISLYREDLRYDLSGLGANIGTVKHRLHRRTLRSVTLSE